MADSATQADALNAALQDDVPEIGPAPNTTVSLIRGIYNSELDTWETTAVVRELNGYDEEALSSATNQSLVYAEYMTFLLKRAVVSVGSVKVEDNPSIIEDLIIGDRDLLFLGVIKATYGPDRRYQVICNSCSGSNDLIVGIDDFPIKKSEVDLKGPITITLKSGKEYKFRLPNGADSAIVAKKGKTTPEQNTIMLSRCVIGVDNGADWARGLSMSDRSEIISLLLDAQPGPQIGEVDAQCAHCGTDMKVMLDWASLLFG